MSVSDNTQAVVWVSYAALAVAGGLLVIIQTRNKAVRPIHWLLLALVAADIAVLAATGLGAPQ